MATCGTITGCSWGKDFEVIPKESNGYEELDTVLQCYDTCAWMESDNPVKLVSTPGNMYRNRIAQLPLILGLNFLHSHIPRGRYHGRRRTARTGQFDSFMKILQ